jgi:hypothetical protein
MNLQELDVQELNTTEMTEVDGGWVGVALFLLGAVVGAAMTTDTDDMVDAWNAGRDAYNNN